MNIEMIWKNQKLADDYSGVFTVSDENGILFEKCGGYRNRSEKLEINTDTVFAIASGTKLFTGLAVCRLIDEKKLSLEDRLWNVLPYDLGKINRGVTIFHLLTHTSGIGDYLDEEQPDSAAQERELCNKYPVYLWTDMEYYLQMIRPREQKFEPGVRFGYSNAGFVMLGLVVEAVSGRRYQSYVADEIIAPAGLKRTGFYRADSLPGNTALGYITDEESGQVRTNIFSLPVVGGSDGGLYTCAGDLDKLWRAVFAGRLLSPGTLQAFLKPQARLGGAKSCGLGVFRCDKGGATAYYAVGGDFGVDFFTVYFPKEKIAVSSLANVETNTYPSLEAVLAAVNLSENPAGFSDI